MRAHRARVGDAAAIADIYNAGIAEGVATFETEQRSAADVARWFGGRHPIVVVEDETGGIVSFAATFPYRPQRACYDGVAEFSVYTAPEARGRGAARAAMAELIGSAEAAGFWKLVSRVFPENVASRRLLESLGFRDVGVYRRHARLRGRWRDVVIVEKLLGAAASDPES